MITDINCFDEINLYMLLKWTLAQKYQATDTIYTFLKLKNVTSKLSITFIYFVFVFVKTKLQSEEFDNRCGIIFK